MIINLLILAAGVIAVLVTLLYIRWTRNTAPEQPAECRWQIQVLRQDVVTETRFWQRRILRHQTRTVLLLVTSFVPRNAQLVQQLNGPNTLSFEAGTYDDIMYDLGKIPMPGGDAEALA